MGSGTPHPMNNHKNIVFLKFLSNTEPDPLKITKLPSQHPLLGHHLMAFRWRADDGPLIEVFVLPPLIN